MNNTSIRPETVKLLALALLMCTVGCSTIKPDWSKLRWQNDAEPALPNIVLPIWTDTVLHQPSKPGIRGFGARVYFYEREGGDPIKVDGSITVYVFDGESYDSDSTKPLRKFVITADQLASHHSISDLGHSYSVWVPWDKVGGPSRTFSLITRFDGRHGGTVVSDAANKLLPGASKTGEATEPEGSKIQQVAYAMEAEAPSLSAPKSYSLTLPSNFQRHLIGSNGQQTSVERSGFSSTLSAPGTAISAQERTEVGNGFRTNN